MSSDLWSWTWFCPTNFLFSTIRVVSINVLWFHLCCKVGRPAWHRNESNWFLLPLVLSGTLTMNRNHIDKHQSRGHSNCKGGLHTLAEAISPFSYFRTGWWIASGPSDSSASGLLTRCTASCLPLFDLVPLTCWVQCSGFGNAKLLRRQRIHSVSSPSPFELCDCDGVVSLNGFLFIEQKRFTVAFPMSYKSLLPNVYITFNLLCLLGFPLVLLWTSFWFYWRYLHFFLYRLSFCQHTAIKTKHLGPLVLR